MAELVPTLEEIRATAARIAPHVLETPLMPWRAPGVCRRLGSGAEVLLKLETLQPTGTFKARGAINNALLFARQRLPKGLTAASAGNHAIATAWAAARIGVAAKVVMVKTANPLRVALAKAEGATVIMADDAVAAFAEAERIRRDDGYDFVHPFDGHATACGTGTLGTEVLRQAADVEAVVVAVGGGGLAGGLAHAIKLINHRCLVLGVEPVGANAMRRSFDAGAPVKLDRIDTIADSLAPPMALPYGFGLCRQALDDLVSIDDDLIAGGLAVLQSEARLAVEPAAGAAAAAMFGPYRARLQNKRTALIVCGANIDADTYRTHLGRGTAALARLD